jgi:ABC-2 type transport system permease protein
MNSSAIYALVRNDLRLYLSDRRAVTIGVLVPIVVAAFFGYIFGASAQSEDQGQIPVAVVDEDHSAVSAAILSDLAADKLVHVSNLQRPAAIEQVKSGKLNAAVILPAGFGDGTVRSLFSGTDKPQVELLVDPSQTTGGRVIEGLLAQYSMQEISKEAFNGVSGRRAIDDELIQLDTQSPSPSREDLKSLLQFARKLNERSDRTTTGDGEKQRFGLSIPYSLASTPVTSRDNVPYNSYAHSFAGMAVQFILFAGIDAGIVLLLTRQRGIWQRLRSAPIKRGEFVLARTLATTLIGLFQLTAIYLAATLFFKVRVEGSWPGLIAVSVAFCLLNATFGLMLATIGRSAASTRGLAMLATLLMVMIGGAWVPSFVFPRWLQTASKWVPTRWAVDGFDGATWRGLPFNAALMPALVLLGSAAVCVLIVLWRFRWED